MLLARNCSLFPHLVLKFAEILLWYLVQGEACMRVNPLQGFKSIAIFTLEAVAKCEV